MANLDAVPGVASSGDYDNNNDEKDVVDFTTMRYNAEHIDKVRSVMGIASGCVAGICGLTGYEGLGTCVFGKTFLRIGYLFFFWGG